MKHTIKPAISSLKLNHLSRILEIERDSFNEFCWDAKDFSQVMRRPNVAGLVAEYLGEIVGFYLYENGTEEIRIMNFAVDPTYRRLGVGTAMVERIKKIQRMWGKRRIVLDISEYCLDAQLFFRRQGFFAFSVMRGFFEETGDDAYCFKYSLCAAEDIYLRPTNRIS